MKITDIFDEDLFRQMQEEKMITLREHEGYPLTIANYSDLCQYKQRWNDVTINCRGLIYEQLTGEVVARPYRKAFNLGDSHAAWIGFDDLVEVTDKADGSLGIVFVYNGEINVATRGSFHSKQAEWATQRIREMDGLDLESCLQYTFLVEIITPWNRIVCDYGNMEELVLLGAVEISTGYYLGPNHAAALVNWPGPVVEVMPYKSINEVLAAPHRDNAEGVVIRAGNRAVKFKYDAYVQLHRLISNLSEKSVWQGLSEGKTAEEMCDGLPDEFHSFVRETSARLLNSFHRRMAAYQRQYADYMIALGAGCDRRTFALAVKDDSHKKYMFAILDAKDIAPMIWQELRPKGNDDSRDALSA